MDAPQSPLRILIVEDDVAMEAVTLAAVSVFVGATLHTARTIGAARDILRHTPIDLAIIDIMLPDGSGLDLLRELSDAPRAAGARGPVCVMHTLFDTDDLLFAALSAGADGYLLKGEDAGMMAARLRAAMRDEPAISPAIARRVLSLARESIGAHVAPAAAPRTADAVTVHLSPRELQVLRLIAQGATLSEVSRVLETSINTLKTQVKRVYAQLDVHTRVEAATKARRLGLLDDGV